MIVFYCGTTETEFLQLAQVRQFRQYIGRPLGAVILAVPADIIGPEATQKFAVAGQYNAGIKLSNLREMQIDSCTLGPGVFEELSALPRLKILRVLKSHDTGPAALKALQKLKSLRHLDFDFTKSKSDANEGVFSNPSWKPEEITALRRLIPDASIMNRTDETEWPALNPARENSRGMRKQPSETPN